MSFLVGITWNDDEREQIEDMNPFDIRESVITLAFTFDRLLEQCFPRKNNANAFVDFAILTQPNNTFESKPISMQFDSIDFNWHAPPQSQMVNFIIINKI